VKARRDVQGHSGRFLGYAPVSLQFPELAAEQLEHSMKFGPISAAIGGALRRNWRNSRSSGKKAEELQALIFIHPNGAAINRNH
jgi:hypothetical protein